jgi:MFS family permease
LDLSKTDGGEERRTPPVGYLELLRRNRDFRLLWLGQVVSQLGDWFNTIALYTLVLEVTGGSGRAIGLVLVTRFLPTVFLGPFAGVVADRFNRRTVMIISDVLRAVVVLGFLFIRRPEHLWMVYALSVLQLALSTFFEPARSAALPSVVADRDLITANTISSITWSAMLTLGAAIGGLIAGWLGTRAAFVLDSVSYLASALLIASLRLPPRKPREKQRLTLGRALGINDMIEGLSYVRTRPRMMALMLVKPAWGMGGGILTLLTVFGEKVFNMGGRTASSIGMLFAARGIGTAIGPLLARRLAGETSGRMQKSIGVSFIITGVFYAGFATAKSLPLALLLLAVAHMGGSLIWISSSVLLQTAVEDSFRGRVFAAEMMLLTLMLAASNYATGEALDRFNISPRAVTLAIGIFFLLPGALWLLTERWWDRETTAGRKTL